MSQKVCYHVLPRVVVVLTTVTCLQILHAQSMYELRNGPRPSHAQLDGTEPTFEIQRAKRIVFQQQQARLIMVSMRRPRVTMIILQECLLRCRCHPDRQVITIMSPRARTTMARDDLPGATCPREFVANNSLLASQNQKLSGGARWVPYTYPTVQFVQWRFLYLPYKL
jgi:hypothetical protein